MHTRLAIAHSLLLLFSARFALLARSHFRESSARCQRLNNSRAKTFRRRRFQAAAATAAAAAVETVALSWPVAAPLRATALPVLTYTVERETHQSGTTNEHDSDEHDPG